MSVFGYVLGHMAASSRSERNENIGDARFQCPQQFTEMHGRLFRIRGSTLSAGWVHFWPMSKAIENMHFVAFSVSEFFSSHRDDRCSGIRAEKRSGTTTQGRTELQTVLDLLRLGHPFPTRKSGVTLPPSCRRDHLVRVLRSLRQLPQFARTEIRVLWHPRVRLPRNPDKTRRVLTIGLLSEY